MARMPPGTALRQIHLLFNEGTVAGLSDAQLLERFASRRDGVAFEALVQRHGPMVLAVCRGVLKDPNDAQDAFQATFLVLVRKAGTLWAVKGSLGSWLYRVAQRIAIQANADAARRREVERRAGEMANPSSADRGAGSDILPALHEEIGRLPEKYRSPIVLCHLEQMTHEEAARHLGWTVGMVRGRVAKARELLRARLLRRGVALSGGLLATVLSEQAALAAVPKAWIDGTVGAAVAIAAGQAAAAGTVSAAAVAWSERLMRGWFMTTMSYTAAALLAAGAAAGLATTFLAARPSDEGPKREDPPRAIAAAGTKARPADSAPVEDARPVPIAGRVVDPEGKPVPEATIYVRHSHFYDWGQEARAVERVAAAGPDGRFHFNLDPARSDAPVGEGPAWHSAQIAAVAPGLGPAWVDAGDAAGGGAELRLVRDDPPIRGRILDTEGRPIAGASVRVERIARLLNGVDRDALLASGKLDWDGVHARVIQRSDWSGPTWIGRGGAVTTDAGGRFTITGVGRDQVGLLTIDAPGLEHATLAVLDRKPPVPSQPRPKRSPTFDPLYGETGLELYGATFEHVLSPSKPITGVVRIKGTGQPVPGVTIRGQVERRMWAAAWTKTDDQGRFRLDGLPKARSYRLDLRPAPGDPVLELFRQMVTDTEGLKPIDVDLAVARGVVVQGRLTDKPTGRAVPCNLVVYVPMPSNPHKGGSHGIGSGTDGTFRITVPPGGGMIAVTVRGKSHPYPAARLAPADKGKLVVKGEDGAQFGFPLSNYNAYRFVEFPKGVESATVDLEVTPGITRQGELAGPDGRPVAGAKAHGLTTDHFGSTTLEGATFEVQGLRPEESRLVEFRHDGLGLAGSATIAGSDPPDRPRVVQLARCGTIVGRLLDEDNQPVRQAKVSATVMSRRGYNPADPAFHPREALTDQAGRFRIEGINPTLAVLIGIQNPNDRATQSEAKPDKDLSQLTVRPGEVLDVGEVRVRFQPVQ